MRYIKATILLTVLILQSSCYVPFFQRPMNDTLAQLKQRYDIHLNSTWNQEHADMLLDIFEYIYPIYQYQKSKYSKYKMVPSVWKISDEDIPDDARIESVNSLTLVTISSNVFSNDELNKEKVKEELILNKTLYRVVAQYITENWTNKSAIELILKDGSDRYAIELVLKEVYGLSIVINDTPESEKIAQKLHSYIGKLHITTFSNQELILLMSVYEKLPKGVHKIPRLKYLLRSQQGPYAGSAWIIADCVEYVAPTFDIKDYNEFQRIIIHEKAHFLWEYALNGKLRKQWSELGGWHRDQNKKHGWSNTKPRKEFVTDYAKSKNPNEDWAESVAFYILHPNILRSCSLTKYEFIDQVMRLYSDGGVPFKRLKQLEGS